LRTHWVLVVMDQYTRRIIGFGVHAGTVDGVALCRTLSHVPPRHSRSTLVAKVPQLRP
jgi:transposase InsO family protein